MSKPLSTIQWSPKKICLKLFYNTCQKNILKRFMSALHQFGKNMKPNIAKLILCYIVWKQIMIENHFDFHNYNFMDIVNLNQKWGTNTFVGHKGIKETWKGFIWINCELSSKLSILIWFLDKGKKAITKDGGEKSAMKDCGYDLWEYITVTWLLWSMKWKPSFMSSINI
jgi:hypothetical protein